MQRTNAESDRHQARRLYPLPVRIMHWINAVAILIMISSGWKVYNDDVLSRRHWSPQSNEKGDL